MCYDQYQHIAPYYDRVTHRALEAPRRRMVALCAERGFGRVLDIGCGTGMLTSMLCEAGIAATGLDCSTSMLARQRELRRLGLLAPFPVLLGSADALPFLPGAFDAAICSLILHETHSDSLTVLREAFRVSSRVLALDWHAPERNIDYLVCAWPHVIERMAGQEHYRHFRRFIRQGGLYRLAYDAGGDIVCAERFLGGSLMLMLLQKRS